jgi:hypothetical protein
MMHEERWQKVSLHTTLFSASPLPLIGPRCSELKAKRSPSSIESSQSNQSETANEHAKQ